MIRGRPSNGLRLATHASTMLMALGLMAWALAGEAADPAPVHAGIALLLVLPVARLVEALTDEIRRRDWPFVALGVIILFQLAASLLLAIYGRP